MSGQEERHPGVQSVATTAALLASGGAAGGVSSVIPTMLPASNQVSATQSTTHDGTLSSHPPFSVRLSTKPSVRRKVKSKKVKRTRTGSSTPVQSSNTGGDQWEVVDDDEALDSLYTLNIPCREGCGQNFTSLHDADIHVRAIHQAPRVDQLSNRKARVQPVQLPPALTPGPGSEQASPVPLIPHQSIGE